MRKLYFLALSILLVIVSCDNDEEQEPIASFTVSKTEIFSGESVVFTNNSLNAVSYEWNFGDGSATLSEENPTYTYVDPGSYTVTLKAIGKGGVSTSSTDISVLEEPRIIAGQRIDQYNVGDFWIDVLDVIALDYYYYNTLSADNIYLHTIVMESEQLAIYLESSNSTTVQDEDPIFFVSAWGNYDGRTPSNLMIGSTLDDVFSVYGVPETENGDGYTVYYYFDKGILFYAENNIVLEIDVFPSSKSSKKLTQETVGLLKNIIGQSFK